MQEDEIKTIHCLFFLTIGGVVLLVVSGCRPESPVPIPTLAPTVVLEQAALLPTGTALPATYTPVPPAPSPTGTPSHSSTATASPSLPAATVVAENLLALSEVLDPVAAATLAPPPLRLVPGAPEPYLTRFRLVTYYGSPTSAALGILGMAPQETMLEQLRAVAAQYQALSLMHYVLPTYHMIVTIADPFPGEDGDYNHWLDETVMEEWIRAADEAGVAVILDVQPGYADVMLELERLRPYLLQPHVHLALDAEFTMEEGEIPGQSLGQLYPEQINQVQEALNEIALETGLNRVLLLHQFEDSMILDKEEIEDYPYVELVFDADGFGSPLAKTGDYLQYSSEAAFEFGGFKLFYDWDWPLMGPADVMEMEPAPAVIIYQ